SCETQAIGFGWSSLHRILLRSPLVVRPRSIALFAPSPQERTCALLDPPPRWRQPNSDLGKFLCIGQFPAKIKSANEAEYLAQRHALIAQAPGHARLHTITHDLGAPSSANAFGISLEPSTSASAWAQSQVRIHPRCRAVHSFRKPCDGLRLPPQRVLQGIVWLF